MRCADCGQNKDPDEFPRNRGNAAPQAEHVDHCHDTRAIRGVLCFGCNRGLGKAKDDPRLIRRAIEYLHAHG